MATYLEIIHLVRTQIFLTIFGTLVNFIQISCTLVISPSVNKFTDIALCISLCISGVNFGRILHDCLSGYA